MYGLCISIVSYASWNAKKPQQHALCIELTQRKYDIGEKNRKLIGDAKTCTLSRTEMHARVRLATQQFVK